jgi:hypothetical protein
VIQIRRLILKLTVASVVVPPAFWVLVASVPAIGEKIGPNGYAISSHYFLRYIDDTGTVRLYRNGYVLLALSSDQGQVAECIAWYGLLCLAVGSIEGFVHIIERHKRRAGGFEVIAVQGVAVAGPAALPVEMRSGGE